MNIIICAILLTIVLGLIIFVPKNKSFISNQNEISQITINYVNKKGESIRESFTFPKGLSAYIEVKEIPKYEVIGNSPFFSKKVKNILPLLFTEKWNLLIENSIFSIYFLSSFFKICYSINSTSIDLNSIPN